MTSLRRSDVATLACPACHGALRFEGDTVRDDELARGTLLCGACGHGWPVRDGLPHLLEEAEVRTSDRLLRMIYDVIAPFHDLGVTIALPIMHLPESPTASRERYIERLDLHSLGRRPGAPPARILEIGIGAGANIPLLERALAPGAHVEIWGLDLSRRMIRQCESRLRAPSPHRVRLLLADAHALPFPDDTFDRVFHVGGINGYGDPARGLAEMARVARPGTPIVVVDEELDPARHHSLYHRLMFWSITWYDPAPHAPVELLPRDAVDVEVTRVSRFYYCLRFRLPGPTPCTG